MALPGQVVIRIICRMDFKPTPADGEYVVEYDPRLVRTGSEKWLEGPYTFKLVTSPDIEKARGFADLALAYEYWRKVCPNLPKRYDGEPNRPLTAFTVEFATVRGHV